MVAQNKEKSRKGSLFVPFNGLRTHIFECATLTIRPSERPSSIYSLMTRMKLSGGGLIAKQIKKKSSNALEAFVLCFHTSEGEKKRSVEFIVT